jgi:hypothetical protein
MQVLTRMAAMMVMMVVVSAVMVGSASAQEAAAAPDEGWLAQAKKPAPWLEFEADFRARHEYFKNVPWLDDHVKPNEINRFRFRTRAGASVKPIENLEVNARVVWEFFVYHKPNGSRDVDPSEALFDKLNVTWRKTFGLDNTIVVGRQEITDLDPWLIFDGTPLDGSRTIFFDAVRNTLELPDAQTTVDLIAILQGGAENKHITPFGYERSSYLVENDEIGAILYVRNKSIERTQIDAAYIYRHTRGAAEGMGYHSNLNTLYASVEHAFNDNWILRVAGAEQFGTRDQVVRNGVEHREVDVWAHAFNARLTYKFRDEWDTDAMVGYEFLSGDNRKGNFNQFDPLWGRWPQFSEIMSSVYATETGPGFVTNLHRAYVGAITRPGPFEFAATYHLLFAHHNVHGFSENGHFRGQLLTGSARWELNRHIAMQLLAEVFVPGNFYGNGRENGALFTQYQIVFKW